MLKGSIFTTLEQLKEHINTINNAEQKRDNYIINKLDKTRIYQKLIQLLFLMSILNSSYILIIDNFARIHLLQQISRKWNKKDWKHIFFKQNGITNKLVERIFCLKWRTGEHRIILSFTHWRHPSRSVKLHGEWRYLHFGGRVSMITLISLEQSAASSTPHTTG